MKGELSLLTDPSFYSHMDRKLKSGKNLDFEESFCSSIFVCACINLPLKSYLIENGSIFPEGQTHILQSTALLSTLSAKEALKGLNSNEIAGLVSGVLELDTVVRLSANEPVLCFGGMGGDKGYEFVGDSKLFSLSTLASFATSLSGLTHKHHSYPNTSKVAGQTTLEEFGARSDFTCAGEMSDVFNQASLIMTSCHNTRTIHALSHVLRGETINHLIGPLAYTIDSETPVQPFIGVNEKIHPQTLAEAILKMKQRNIQNYDRGVVFAGLSAHPDTFTDTEMRGLTDENYYYNSDDIRNLVRLDEVAPPPYGTLACFFLNDEFLGNYILSPEDFYDEDVLANIELDKLLIQNKYNDIMEANYSALKGDEESKSRYLAMTIGLANFVRFSLHDECALNSDNFTISRNMLRMHTAQAYEDIKNGNAYQKMKQYCEANTTDNIIVGV